VGHRQREVREDRPDASPWVKSSLSMGNGKCVEVAGLSRDLICVRDSKNPEGAVLGFTAAEWNAFVASVRKREFDHQRRLTV
jgi:hypothetical protein